jgi:hypothetical protein
MSKDLYFEMKAEQLATMYDATFTKKEAQAQGVNLVKTALDEGNVLPHELMANIARLKEVVNAADAELRKHLPEDKITVMGVEFTPVNGGNTVNYKDDDVWLELKSKLSHRESLLKVALNSDQDFYDEEGVKVPKVSTTPRKSSITIKF